MAIFNSYVKLPEGNCQEQLRADKITMIEVLSNTQLYRFRIQPSHGDMNLNG
jgi:hypothetical protein